MSARPKRIAILGSTGSIGRQTLEVAASAPEQFTVVGLAAGSDIETLKQQALEFRPALVAIADESGALELAADLEPAGIEVVTGADGIDAVAGEVPADIVVAAIVGTAGLGPTLTAIRAGRVVALANKEVLVAAGHLVMDMIDPGQLIPVDSEHSAIFQCLAGRSADDVQTLWLTGSGGPFWDWSREDIDRATPAQALRHPRWQMGPKVTVDSASMMNKGLELIEAHWLFNVDWDRLDAVIHRQSIVHSLVEFIDGSVIAQASPPDMRLPIAVALAHPDRIPGAWPRLDLSSRLDLTFEPPDLDRFPCLELARACGSAGGLAPVVLNAANERAVELFLCGAIPFGAIWSTVSKVVEQHQPHEDPGLEQILEVDRWARDQVAVLCGLTEVK